MGFLFPKPKEPKPAAPAPKMDLPGEEQIDIRKKKKGRADTILAGDLVPMETGQRSLLG